MNAKNSVPEETFWYHQREQGTWFWWSMIIIFGHFFAPFLLLLRIDMKENFKVMSFVAAWAGSAARNAIIAAARTQNAFRRFRMRRPDENMTGSVAGRGERGKISIAEAINLRPRT